MENMLWNIIVTSIYC